MGEHINNAAEKYQATKFVIGDGEGPQNLIYTSIDSNQDFSVYGRKAQLILAQCVDVREEVSEHKVRKWLIPRHVSQTTQHSELTDNPFLAVAIGNDTVLPIASFARRSDGQCSYVQLGQEVYDDNFYVTTGDDETVRHGLIEALREQVKEGSHRRGEKNERRVSTIQRFINGQVEAQHFALAQAYEQQLVRKSFERLEKADKGALTLVGENQSGSPEQFNISTLIPTCILNDGRAVRLVLARSSADTRYQGDRLGLLAVTRESVASELATMSTQFMQVELNNDDGLSPSERERTIRDLLYLIIARPVLKDLEADKKDYDSSTLEGDDRQIAELLFNIGVLGKYEKWHSRDYYDRKPVEVEPHIRRQIETFLAHPDPKQSPFPNSAPMRLAVSRLSLQQTSDRELLNRLQAGKVFSEVLGEVRRCDEVLMHYVAKLALKNGGLGAIFHNVQIGKTKAGAKVAASATTNDGAYELSITGRPESMPDEPMKPLLSATLDPTMPFLGQEAVRNGRFNEKHVEELIDIISRIISVNQ